MRYQWAPLLRVLSLSINEIMVLPLLYLGMDSKGHKRNYHHHLTLGFHVSIESRLPGPTVSIQAIELRARDRVKNREIRARVPGNGSRGLAPAPQPGLPAGKSPSMSSRTVNQRGKTGSWNVRSTARSPVISHLHDLKCTYKLNTGGPAKSRLKYPVKKTKPRLSRS